MSVRAVSLDAVRRWELWTVPKAGVRYLLLIDAVALVLAVVSGFGTMITGADMLAFGVLSACAVAHNELARGIERARREIENIAHVDLSSVWLFAGVLLLPMPLNVALIALVYSHYWWRNPRVPVHRRVFGMAALVISTQATVGVLSLIGGPGRLVGQTSTVLVVLVVVLSLLVYTTVDVALIAGRVAIYRAPGQTVHRVFGDPGNHMLEISNLFYGSMVAFALSYNPVLVVLALPPVLVLHRSVLLKQVEEKARKDAKTGLFNSDGWHRKAARERSRAQRSGDGFGLLMIDLDHFKRVNDTYGHVAGDAVLKAVADAISSEVRDYDSVGRFGGEEFVVLLPGMSEEDGIGVAERIRHAVTQLAVAAPVNGSTTTITNLSASIGVSVFPSAGDEVEPLLMAADAALYEAKNTGRNRVVSWTELAKPRLAVAA
jgi:diguanylate cyclase (GGDEF)-like protein